MPAEYYIDQKQKLVISRGTGRFSYNDYLAHIDAVGHDPRFAPTCNHLIECRHFEAIDISGPQMMDLATRSVFSAGSLRAFVVEDQAEFGLARMLSLYRERAGRSNTAAFHSVSDALTWLGLPQDYSPGALRGWISVPAQEDPGHSHGKTVVRVAFGGAHAD